MMIDNFLYPSVMHYIVYSLYKSLGHSVFDSHNFMMRDINLPREYGSYKESSDLFMIYHTAEGIYLRNILLPRTRSALTVKFLKEQMSELLRASYPNQLVYENSNDIILGTDNQIGEIMMENRMVSIVENGPFTIEEYNERYKNDKVISYQKNIEIELPDMSTFKDKFNDKIKDILYVIESYKKDLKKIPDMKFIINDLYHYKSCFRNYNVSFPPWFRKYTKDLNNRVVLTESDIKMLWNYIVSYNIEVESKLVEHNIDEESVNKEIARQSKYNRPGIYHNFIKIVKRIKDVSLAPLENCVLFVYHIVSDSNKELDLKKILKEHKEHKEDETPIGDMDYLISIQLEKNKLGGDEDMYIQMSYMFIELMKHDMSRLFFFSDFPSYESKEEVAKQEAFKQESIPSEDEDIVYDVEEESEKEKDDDDLERDDYGEDEDEEDNEY